MARRRVKLSIAGPLIVTLVLALTLVMLTSVSAYSWREQTQQRETSQQQQALSTWAKLLFDPLYNLDVSALRNTLEILLEAPGVVHVAARDIEGRVIAEATETWVPDRQVNDELTSQALREREVVYREIKDYLVLSSPITSGLEQIGTLTVAINLEQIQAPLEWTDYTVILLVSAGLITGAAMLVVLFSRRAVLQPIKTLCVATDNIRQGNLDTPVPIRGMAELATLGQDIERMRFELQGVYANLEKHAALQEQYAQQLLTITEITRDIIIELDTQTLLEKIVSAISERFELYNVALFLLDETGQWIELRAISHPGGRRILEHGGLRLRVGESSIVGYVTRRNEPYLVLDVEKDVIYLPDANLPDTRSELALPLRARGENLGALDLQSDKLNAFDQQDTTSLQALADHVALAISNARRFQQEQQILEGAQQAYGEVSYRAWAELLRSQASLGYYSDADGLTPLANRPPHDESLPELKVPITVRGRTIGSVRAFKPADAGAWTPEESTLLETLTEQLNVALESARLHQTTQRSAAQERLVGEITARMRESLNLDTVMQIAAREIGETLGLHDVSIQLETR
jgi:GAF domain-containing protein/HAMP domain-containing protein